MLRTFAAKTARPLSRALPQSTQVAGIRNLHGSRPTEDKEAPLPPSLVEKYKLDDPTRFVPLTIGGFTLATLSGLYHIDGESQILALWVIFCGTIYSRGGPLIAEMLDEMKNSIKTETAKLESAEIDAVKTALEAHKSQLSIYDDIKGLFDTQQEVVKHIVSSAENRLKREIRNDMIKKLDNLVLAEEKLSEELRNTLVNGATAAVKGAYTGSDAKKLKTTAIDAAIAALSSPATAKKDATVSELYLKHFKDFQANLKAKAGSDIEFTEAERAELQEVADSIIRRDGLDITYTAPKSGKLEIA
mmetsp:Transcript_21045/g.41280  ORF Transcript_21045/g.41280 Transcript_21045/m.41280 type:complete len:303 (+) Transcript_21045:56-964(+)|eukprot:CAMPEP_0171504728 /NCGR_PEP_ID=MMETSP0958-20121227/11762_1 /TAXON_ID=87120 /ORGANISM="Aurantiochytrium limacinum, Strain ATCCMYA-1381" /LENGTH=302 /DNA_ID=CAMNT_0012040661 /DNA_START=57 /DNA_END=965 /DNA_ORIENTATION=+